MHKNDIDTLQGDWSQIAYERDDIMNPVDVEQGWNPLGHMPATAQSKLSIRLVKQSLRQNQVRYCAE
ncbi:MAG: hypothetical protein WCK49_08040 [Myxococcaceae bacterium]